MDNCPLQLLLLTDKSLVKKLLQSRAHHHTPGAFKFLIKIVFLKSFLTIIFLFEHSDHDLLKRYAILFLIFQAYYYHLCDS